MATIMTAGNSQGTRRCDASCHTARKPKCACICGGRYHGTGSSEKSQDLLTRDWLGEDWEKMRDELGAKGFEAAVTTAIEEAAAQGELFGR